MKISSDIIPIKMNYDATRRNRMGTMSRLGVNLILLEFFLLIIQFVIGKSYGYIFSGILASFSWIVFQGLGILGILSTDPYLMILLHSSYAFRRLHNHPRYDKICKNLDQPCSIAGRNLTRSSAWKASDPGHQVAAFLNGPA